MTGSIERVQRAFEAFCALAPQPSWLDPIRQRAVQQLVQAGFPGQGDERWKYTRLTPLVESSFRFPFEFSKDAPMPAAAGLHPYPSDWIRLVFVNGRWSAADSVIPPLGSGIRLTRLSQSLARPSDPSTRPPKNFGGLAQDFASAGLHDLRTTLGQVSAVGGDALTWLNTAFMEDGLSLSIDAGVTCSVPIHVIYVGSGAPAPILVQPRNWIHLGRGSSAVLVESHMASSDSAHWTNAVSEMILQEGAGLTHYQVQSDLGKSSVTTSAYIRQGRDSRYQGWTIALGAALARHQVHVTLDAPGGTCVMNGLYVLTDRQHVDFQTLIDHAHPNGKSRQVYKGILDGRSRAAFNGRIIVRQDAQQTDAQQINKNLLLSDGAVVDTKPQLEILADDVKCTHGAAVGQLDPEAMFYLKSRGVGQARARQILTHGFVNDLVSAMELEPIRARMDHWVAQQLGESEWVEEVSP